MASFLTELTNPRLVASFQKWCGVELVDDDDGDSEDGDCLDSAVGERSTVTNNGPCPTSIERRSAVRTRSTVRTRSARASTVHEKSTNNNNNDDKPSHPCSNGVSHANNDVINHRLYDNRVNGIKFPANDENHSFNIQRCQAWGNLKEDVYVNGNASVPKKRESHPILTGGKSPTRVVIRYPVLYYWAKVGAFLGNEEFYLTGLPFMFWAVDCTMLRQTVVVWWLVMYLGQAGKDYFAWPRPPTPPVVRLETAHLAEYSMPSTHAMAGTAIPLILSKLLLERYQLPTGPVLCVAFFWCFTTCLSRLYLGVHTVLDVLSGFLVSLTLYFLVSPLTAGYDLYQQSHPLAPLVLILTSLALCTICYPSGPGKISAKHDAITTTAVVVGLGVGVWINYQLGFSQLAPKPVRLPVTPLTFTWLGVSLLQFVVGVAVVYGLKVVLKRLTVSFFSFFFGLDDSRLDSQQHPGVDVGSTYVTYLCLGVAITFLNPWLFTLLGFGRPGYYLEVL